MVVPLILHKPSTQPEQKRTSKYEDETNRNDPGNLLHSFAHAFCPLRNAHQPTHLEHTHIKKTKEPSSIFPLLRKTLKSSYFHPERLSNTNLTHVRSDLLGRQTPLHHLPPLHVLRGHTLHLLDLIPAKHGGHGLRRDVVVAKGFTSLWRRHRLGNAPSWRRDNTELLM